ncbi:unnamed protein product, partial [Mesorhabditis belari]|uniref:Uncharacterized protein n=1 Tax=Mesorhabditis belari TaxID=2138241 RepID=A0AAF3FM12_9BILA
MTTINTNEWPPSNLSNLLVVADWKRVDEIGNMTDEDKRNTCIFEMSNRTRNTKGYYQALNDQQLVGNGALYAVMRVKGWRTAAEMKNLTMEDLRETAIVNLNYKRIPNMQSYSNFELASWACCDDMPMVVNFSESNKTFVI